MSEIERVVQQWITSASLSDRLLTSDSRLVAEGWLDSLQIVQLVEYLEQRFSVSIDLDEMVPENFDTVGAVAALVSRSSKSTRSAS
jgi:acyl carrier protein